jgi:hypothetical protein
LIWANLSFSSKTGSKNHAGAHILLHHQKIRPSSKTPLRPLRVANEHASIFNADGPSQYLTWNELSIPFKKFILQVGVHDVQPFGTNILPLTGKMVCCCRFPYPTRPVVPNAALCKSDNEYQLQDSRGPKCRRGKRIKNYCPELSTQTGPWVKHSSGLEVTWLFTWTCACELRIQTIAFQSNLG